jgi:hypothetical protein
MNLPFTREFPDHSDSNTPAEYLVERCVTGRDHFTAIAHDIS